MFTWSIQYLDAKLADNLLSPPEAAQMFYKGLGLVEHLISKREKSIIGPASLGRERDGLKTYPRLFSFSLAFLSSRVDVLPKARKVLSVR